jgi:dTDP-4-amino-4,6-dideoxygalactose transaminase
MALDAHAQERRSNAERLLERLGDLSGASIFDRTTAGSAVKLALVLSPERPSTAALIEALAAAGIEAQCGYTPCHLLVEHPRAQLPNVERVWRDVVCLPLETTLRDGARLSRCLEAWYGRNAVWGRATEQTIEMHATLSRPG